MTLRNKAVPGRGQDRWSILPLALLAALGPFALPQQGQAQEVVQQLPNPASATLTDALRRLSRSPGSLPALLDAGRSSLELDDVEAAEGFFLRAAAVAPNDGAVLAGLALVAVRQVDPHTAIRLFEQARAAGENIDPHAADHGLAFDLVGRNAEAQERYRVALSRGSNVEVERRLALSFAIAGDQDASEATLLPLLQRRDVAAYRTRAFALAILGREEEAVSIAEVMLPARIARRMDPYLRNMGQLTPSQQAAAANLGVFPASTEMGREPVQLTRSIDLSGPPAQSGQSDARLIPGGEPLGPGTGLATAGPETPARPAAVDTPREALATTQGELPPLARQPAPQVASRTEAFTLPPAEAEPASVPVPVAEPEPALAAVVDVPGPSFSLATPAAEPAILERAAEPEPEPVSLAEAFAAFTLPPAAVAPAQAAPGAVDITAIVPVREVRTLPPPPSPPPPPPHPSRIWVQVATGQDVAAFRFDWRRLVREADGLLASRQAYRARWGQTNRLVTGPFASTREANAFVTALGEKGIDSFRFTSAAGEEVVAIN